MGAYTIGQVAERTGFTTSALRYYEGMGLVTPTSRTESGYRICDDQTLARLSFIDRAKRLGCSLEEIVGLIELWAGDECAPVQRHQHDLVATKIADAERQVEELTALQNQLRDAFDRLAEPAVDGPCSEDCACLTGAPRTGAAVPVPKPPIACTLDAGAAEAQAAAWHAVLGHATSRSAVADGAVRIEFGPDVPLGELADLMVAEKGCCAFFSFALTVDHRGVALEVSAPADAADVMTMLFG